MNQEHVLSQNCPATAIPAGDKVRLSAGTKVFITQSLGGNVTVRTDHGLFQIAKENAGLIEGYSARDEVAAVAGEFSEQAVWDALKTCFDPEIPVNIVDLGLIYTLEIKDLGENRHGVEVKMTLTAPGCGMGPAIAEDARARLVSVPGVSEAKVEIVWDPPWNQERISEEGKMQLGLL